jgi:flagellar hook-associated protein FlgK
MPSTFGSLNIALRTLDSMQRAIEVSGHNVANAATPGYSRQTAVFVASDPYSVPALNYNVSAGQVGTGVTVDAIQRFRSDFLDSQIQDESLFLKGWEVRRDVLRQVEVTLNEPSDAGINSSLSAFWTAWNELATTPGSTAARAYVVETASGLSTSLREAQHQLSDLQSDLDERVAIDVEKVNDLAHRIADLNKTIRNVEGIGQQANDLRDQRGQLLAELTGLININAHESETGSVMVSMGGKLLVMDHVVSEIAVEQDPANAMRNRIVWADTGAVVQIGGIPLEGGLSSLATEQLAGELGATLIARDLILPDKMSQLDDIANALIGAVNGLHQTGFGLNGTAGGGLTSTSTVPGTVDGFSLAPPMSGSNGLADGTFFVEIRDNANILEFRLVDSAGKPMEIYDSAAGDGSFTNAWQTLDLVDGTSFDTGRGLVIDFAALSDHSLGTINTNMDVNGFSLSGVASGTPELPTDSYYVEVRDNGGNWEFRLVDSAGSPVQIYDDVTGDGSLTSDWQTIPAAPQSFDTRRGLTIDFTSGPYTETLFGGVPLPANVHYTARGTQVGTRGNGAASVGIGSFFTGTGAQDIAVSDYITADYNRIATAAVADSPGDGSIALGIARLESAAILNGGTTTIGDYYRGAIAELGQEAQQADIMASNHDLLLQHLEARQEEIAGVSLDEETVHLLQFQRTYQAAARVMTTVDEMLDKVINGMGLVGR